MINMSNVTGTLSEYRDYYEADCPDPFIEPDANNLQELYDGLDQATKYLDAKEPIHIASNAICIIIVIVQVFCVYKIYWDYGYVMFRNEGASIQKRSILLRIQSFLTILKVYGFFSFAIFLDILSISIMIGDIPTLAIIYVLASILGSFAGYYGFRDLNYYLSSFHITMIITQIIILGFMYVLVLGQIGNTNHRWNLSLLATKLLINTYMLVNAIWCILDFPVRSRDDSKFS